MDVFDEALCRFYEGTSYNSLFVLVMCADDLCGRLGSLIVEIHDHRHSAQQQDVEPNIKRVVMRPTAESLWTDILLLNEVWGSPWTQDIALEVESKVLVG